MYFISKTIKSPTMAKQLLVKTPQTTDGIQLQYDDNKQPVVKETLLPITAKRQFEGLNTHLPEQLRHELIELDETGAPIADTNEGTAGAETTTRRTGGKK